MHVFLLATVISSVHYYCMHYISCMNYAWSDDYLLGGLDLSCSSYIGCKGGNFTWTWPHVTSLLIVVQSNTNIFFLYKRPIGNTRFSDVRLWLTQSNIVKTFKPVCFQVSFINHCIISLILKDMVLCLTPFYFGMICAKFCKNWLSGLKLKMWQVCKKTDNVYKIR